MKVYTSPESFKDVRNPVLTTGTFDGVHKGHRHIIDRLRSIADEADGETVVFTFFPHPRMILFPDDTNLRLLNTQNEKIELLEKAGVDHLIIFPFSKEFSRLNALEFVRDILVNQLHISRLVIGYDHQFGRNREGTIAHLRELSPMFGFQVEEIPAQMVDSVNVSSTKIRAALTEGDIATAANFLGYNYPLTGLVVGGQQIGRSIGFPTANLKIIDNHKLIPGDGVYAVNVSMKAGQFGGMLNIGSRPTINSGASQKSIEVNIFDFEGELYNELLKVEFIKKIRDERKFEDLSRLKLQLENDRLKAKEILFS